MLPVICFDLCRTCRGESRGDTLFVETKTLGTRVCVKFKMAAQVKTSFGALYHELSDEVTFCSNCIKYDVLVNSIYDWRFLFRLITRSLTSFLLRARREDGEDHAEKVDLCKGYWNPHRGMRNGVATHFFEIVSLEPQLKC